MSDAGKKRGRRHSGARRSLDGEIRDQQVTVKFTLRELELAKANAATEVPPLAVRRYIAEAAIATKNPRRTKPQRVRAELLGVLADLQRQVTGAATNINQMAKVANSTGEISPAAPHVVDSLMGVVVEIRDAVRMLSAEGKHRE